jgi:glycosyltransferase involved in cell wall biosynthesis
MSSTAVVILNYNGGHFLDKFIPTLIEYTENCDLIVADNKSTDSSLEILKKFADRVRVIELEENFGYAGGYNQALKDLPNEFLILLNSDVEVTENWTFPLINLLEKEGKVVAAQPKIKDFNNKDRFEYAGAAGGYMDKLGYPFCRGRIFNTLEKDVGQYENPTQIFWSTGAFFFIRAKVFKDIPFDKIYSTDYKRTQQTALPTAKSKGLEVLSYGTENLFNEEFKTKTEKQTVLIVGHSNTTPAFVNTITGTQEHSQIDDSDNGKLFIVTIADSKSSVIIEDHNE